VDLKGMLDRAKRIFEKRGGAEAAKGDVAELRHIAQSDQSLANNGKDAAETVKQPDAT
jgi:hypothetical protein